MVSSPEALITTVEPWNSYTRPSSGPRTNPAMVIHHLLGGGVCGRISVPPVPACHASLRDQQPQIETDGPRRVVHPERIWCTLQVTYHARQDVDALGDGLLVDGRVAEDKAAGTGVADPVGRDALDADSGAGGRVDHGGFVHVWRQPGDQVQPGGDADRLEPRQPPGQGGQQGVAAPPVDRAHPAQVPVELAADDEVGEGEL